MAEFNQKTRIRRPLVFGLGLTAMMGALYWLIRYWKQRSIPKSESRMRFKPIEQGLSEAEVAERHTDARLQARLEWEQQTRHERRHRNIFSILSLTILVLSISQVVLKDYLGALATLGTLLLNIAVNIFQEARSARKVAELAAKARPMAAVIRDGSLKSIDQDDVVVGDILVAGRGDEILADGLLVESTDLTIDESMLAGQAGIVTKETGELLLAGSSCASGWAVYRVERENIEKPEDVKPNSTTTKTQTKTPLQIILDRVLYVILFFAAIFYITLMLDVFRSDILPAEVLTMYRDVMSIIFSIAPGGLFLMIVINYAVGSADIARSDALVKDSMSIESLAQVSTICMIRRGGVTGLVVELEMIPPQPGSLVLSESRVRQVLGNYVHSIQGDKFPLTILRQDMGGEKRTVDQQSRHLSIYGWEAATFTSTDMPGSYVIGYPEVLKSYLAESSLVQPLVGETGSEQEGQGAISNRIKKLFRRGKTDSQPPVEETLPEETQTDESDAILPDDADTDHQEEKKHTGILRRMQSRLVGIVRRQDEDHNQDKQQAEDDQPEEILRLMFAYSPNSQPIYDAEQQPHCPRELIPVCYVRFVEQVRPEVNKAIKTFLDAGVSIKILADDEPMKTLAIARQLGLVADEPDKIPFAVGEEVSQFSPAQLSEAVRDKSIFALLSQEQSAQIVSALREQDEFVAVMGASIADLPIMRKANLSITRQGSNPTVLDQANIILLKNSPTALPEVLQKGQRIVNGMLDVLKINLTQMLYIMILLGVMFISGERIFFYHPTQGGAIGIFTVVLPAVALSFWSATVAIHRKTIHIQLVHFFVPAAVMTALGVIVLQNVFIKNFSSIVYTQLAVTHLLVSTGLLLVVFVQPPVRFLAGGDEFSGDWRPTYVAGILFLVFQIATHMALAQRYLKISPLASLQDYLIVWGISLVWAILLLVIWRLRWLNRILGWGSRWMVSSQE